MINISKEPYQIQYIYEGDYDGVTFEIRWDKDNGPDLFWMEDPGHLTTHDKDVRDIEDEIIDKFLRTRNAII